MVAHMKPRYAAALALVGWYLMLPPPGTNPFTTGRWFEKDAPLSTWYLEKSFDTAEDCDRARQKKYDEASSKIKVLAESHSIQASADAQILAGDKFNRCIETDDPRLNEQAQ